MNSPSRVYYENFCSELVREDPSVPVVVAHGDPDDHMRLIAILAKRFRDANRGDCDAAQACLLRKISWEDRVDAFQELLRSVDEGPIGCIVDIDALEPSPTAKPYSSSIWDDSTVRERKKTLRYLLESIDRGGWTLLRPFPKREFSEKLIDIRAVEVDESVTPLDSSPSEEWETLLATLPSAIRNLAEGLLRVDFESDESLYELLQNCQPDETASVLLETAYDALTNSVRQTAKRLAIQRGPQQLNGHLGAFHFTSSDHEENSTILNDRASIPKSHIEALRDAGWFARHDESLVMHAVVRQFLTTRYRISAPDERREDHRWLGELNQTGQPIEAQLETHHHAVMGGDAARAVETALYYGSDLRELAYRLSRQGSYRKAAELYRTILDEFDPTDAYSWEYFGYNLARQYTNQAAPQSIKKRIRSAYRKACELDEKNPLYRGRLIGFRAAQGEDVTADFNRWMTLFGRRARPGDDRFFAKTALQGLEEGGQTAALRKLVAQWKNRLHGNEEIPKRWFRL